MATGTQSSEQYRLEVIIPPPDAHLLAICQSIRRQVFVDEQGVPAEAEYDGKDHLAHHVLCFYGQENTPIATGRVTITERSQDETHNNVTEAIIARIAVIPNYRKRGFGRMIVQKLEEIALGYRATRISLTPHHYLEGFYQSLGYERVPDDKLVKLNEHCSLIAMHKYLEY